MIITRSSRREFWRQDLQVKAEEALSCCCTAAAHVWVERSSTACSAVGWPSGIVKLLKSAVGRDTGRGEREIKWERKRDPCLSPVRFTFTPQPSYAHHLPLRSLIKAGVCLDQGSSLTHTFWACDMKLSLPAVFNLLEIMKEQEDRRQTPQWAKSK